MGTYRKRIESASVYDVAIQSPLEAAPQLSERLGNTVLLKREDLQPVHSFKLRGAYNKVAKLSAKQRVRGVICASAGNHAQGLALAASRAGIKSLIVMPRTTPSIKVEAVKRFGSRILLHGDTYDEAYEEARRQAAERGMSFVHPYDDPDVIAGQGTVGMEILRQHPGKLDAVFVPVGGGGFIAGVAAYIKAVRPKVKVIGVEPEDAACLQAALKTGKRVVLDQIGLFADGVAVRQAGAEPFKLARRYVDEVVTASVDEICAATRDIFEENRSLPEPAGALALAGLKNHVAAKKWSGKTLVAIESGSNVNFDRLRHIAERAEIGEHREALLAVTIPERPGSFRQFCADLGKRGITEFNYRYADRQAAHIFVGVRLQDGVNEKDELVAQLRASDYAVADLTDNEMAKVHVRYMVGGRASGVDNEILFRFEFPERPGALLQFLNQIGSRWNISLFHYRNHGAAYGR
ncbi:MAG: threonine ammonia-lyase, biosynthetic, partial [Nevskiales bacterium]